jgi:hypothetical protein
MKPKRTAELARALLERGGSLESAAGTGPIEDSELVAAISQRLTSPLNGEARLEPEVAAVAAKGIAARARGTLDQLAGGASPGTLSEIDLSGLEAIVMLTGRPPLRYLDGVVEMPPEIGENEIWRVLVADQRKQIEARSASVGLIAREPPNAPIEPLGTGWRLGDKFVVTNRHVVQHLADSPSKPVKAWRLNPTLTASVDFWAVTKPSKKQRFPLKSIAWCADFDGPDLGILEFAIAEAPPAPLPIDWSEATLGRTLERESGPTFQGRQVYVVGHPWRVTTSGPIAQVFGKADGHKRCSPGCVTAINAARKTFEHDCSTLGGNSGSCVLSVDQHAVVGVHYAGVNVHDNGVGSSNKAIAIFRLAGSEVGTILSQGRV